MKSWITWGRLLWALLVGLALATAGSFFRGSAWWLDILTDFKVQYVASAALLFLAALASRRAKEAVLALVLLGINGVALAPHLAPAPSSRTAMKIVGFNLDMFNTAAANTLDFLHRENADVVVVYEVTVAWREALRQLSDIYPHRYYGPLQYLPGNPPQGMGLLSKRAWEETGVEVSDISSRTFAVWARFPAASPSLTVVGVHLSNPVYYPASHQRSEAVALASIVKRFDGPVVVTGDFNMTPFSARYGTLLGKTGLRRADGGLNATWPAMLTPLGLSLDHVLIGKGIRNATMRTGPWLGSDHLPVVGTFDLGG
jgi:endonuclease/exonuclease/phosphatase (EEP) superfamily protein YafD